MMVQAAASTEIRKCSYMSVMETAMTSVLVVVMVNERQFLGVNEKSNNMLYAVRTIRLFIS